MKLGEKIDNYLISLGCSISEDYTFIVDANCDFKIEQKEEKIQIANKKVLLSMKVLSTMLIDSLLLGSSYVFMQHAHNVIQEKGQDEVFELCDILNSAAKVYYTDYIKFVRDKFDLTEAIFDNLVSLINASIQNTSSNIDKLLEKNHMQKLEAVQRAAADRSASDARIIAEAANKARSGYTRSYTSAGLLSGVNTQSFAYTGKAMSDVQLAGQFEGSAMFQADMERIYKNGANADTIRELIDTINRLILKFNKDLEEILVLKFSDVFNKDVFNNVGDVEKNPLFLDGYKLLFDDMSDSDVENFKKVIDFYKMDIKDYLIVALTEKIYDEYVTNNKYVYDKPIAKLYFEVSGSNNLEIPELQDKLYKYYISEIDKVVVTINEDFKEIKSRINDCIYLNEETKKKLNFYINKKLNNNKDQYSNATFKMKAAIVSIALNLVLGVFVAWAEIFEQEVEGVKLTIYGICFFAAVVLAIINIFVTPKIIINGIKTIRTEKYKENQKGI